MDGAILDESFKRGIVVFAITFLLGLGGNLLIVDLAVREVIGLSLVPAVTAFAVRTGYEGAIDTHRARTGRMLPSDVPVVSDKVEVTPKA